MLDALEQIGKAHNKTIAQTALAWLLTNPIVTAPIIGANSVEQLNETMQATGYRLTAEAMVRLNQASDFPHPPRPIWD